MSEVYEYTADITVDLCKVAPEDGSPILGDLNAGLSTFGVDGRLAVNCPLTTVSMTCDRNLSPEERKTVERTILLEFQKRFPSWGVKITPLRSKSQKSCSQPNSR